MSGGMNQFARLAIEAGPLAAFFVANSQAGIMTGTAVFMVAITIAVAVSWRLERRIPIMPVVGASYPLAEVPEAMRQLESGQARGKIAITI